MGGCNLAHLGLHIHCTPCSDSTHLEKKYDSRRRHCITVAAGGQERPAAEVRALSLGSNRRTNPNTTSNGRRPNQPPARANATGRECPVRPRRYFFLRAPDFLAARKEI